MFCLSGITLPAPDTSYRGIMPVSQGLLWSLRVAYNCSMNEMHFSHPYCIAGLDAQSAQSQKDKKEGKGRGMSVETAEVFEALSVEVCAVISA